MGRENQIEHPPTVKYREVCLPSWANQNDQFAVSEVCGESLSDLEIHDGDFAVFHITGDIGEGQLGAVLTPVGLLLKLVYFEGAETVRLESANSDYESRWFRLDEVNIQGPVVRIERDFDDPITRKMLHDRTGKIRCEAPRLRLIHSN